MGVARLEVTTAHKCGGRACSRGRRRRRHGSRAPRRPSTGPAPGVPRRGRDPGRPCAVCPSCACPGWPARRPRDPGRAAAPRPARPGRARPRCRSVRRPRRRAPASPTRHRGCRSSTARPFPVVVSSFRLYDSDARAVFNGCAVSRPVRSPWPRRRDPTCFLPDSLPDSLSEFLPVFLPDHGFERAPGLRDCCDG